MAQASQTKINLACGAVFITGDGWINLDYSTPNPAVQRADSLARLPLSDDSAGLVYSSHFLEHIPRGQVPGFLAECWRILAPGGVLRLVLPDLDNLCRAYLMHRERGEHEKANFLVLEMIDQCVRRESGGELGRMYRQLKSAPEQNVELIDFVRERTGEHLLVGPTAASVPTPRGVDFKPGGSRPRPCRASLDTGGPATATQGVPRTERQPGRRRRAPPVAVGSRATARRAASGRLRGDRTLRGIGQLLRRFPLPAVGSGRRRSPAQGRRVDVYRGAQARLVPLLQAGLHCRGRHD